MASFTLDGISYEYLRPDPGHDPEAAHSWTYGQYPKVMATLPLAPGTAAAAPPPAGSRGGAGMG